MSESSRANAGLQVELIGMDEAMKLLVGREVKAIVDQDRKVVALIFGDDVISTPDEHILGDSLMRVFEALELAPQKGLDEDNEGFLVRYRTWFYNHRQAALAKALPGGVKQDEFL